MSKGRPRLGLKIKWCPFEGCNLATHVLRSHLQRRHKRKNGEVRENYLQIAREYKGKQEKDKVEHCTSSLKRKRSASREIIEPPEKIPKGDSDNSIEVYSSEQDTEDDKDEDSQISGSQVEYFTSKTPRNDRHKWLICFYDYLHYPDCRRKKNRNRLQHASHKKTILEDLDPEGTRIDILAEEEGYIVWNQWVDRKMETNSSGTIIAYLGTFEKFLAFVMVDPVRPGTVKACPGRV